MARRFAFTVDAAIDSIPVVMDGIESYLADVGVDPAIVPDIQLAVDEAMTNIITHGYRGSPGTIAVACSVGRDRVRIEIRDRGPAFNPLTIQDPDLTADIAERAVGGLGIYLVRKVMDSVSYEYRDGENVLRMEKKLPE